MKKFLYIQFLLFVLLVNGFSQPKGLEIDLYTIKDGLSQTRVNVVFIDSKGFLWVGTHDGLNRYDGYHFTIYQNNPSDSTTLADNFINSICEDKSGNIWIATNNGLSKFDRKTENFVHSYHNNDDPLSLDDNYVYCVYMSKEGTLWIKTLEFLSKYNEEEDNFTKYNHYTDFFLTEGLKYVLYEDHEGKLWMGNDYGLSYFNRNIEIFERFEYNENDPNSISDNYVKAIYEDSKNNLWVGTQKGLNKFNREDRTFKKYYSDPINSSNGPVNNDINSIYEDSDGQLWIGTKDGISKYDSDLDIFINYKQFFYDFGTSYLNSSISSIVEDDAKILWIGTLQGLVKLDRKKKKFNLYNKSLNSLPDLSGNSVSSIFLDKYDKLWVGTTNFGLNIVNRRTKNVEKYSKDNFNPSKRISGNNVQTIFEDSRGAIWIGTNRGLDIYDQYSMTFRPACEVIKNISCDKIGDKSIYVMYEDKDNNIWIGTNPGLFRYNREESEFERYIILENDSVRVDFDKVFAIAEDEQGIMWFGTNRGLIKYDLKKDQFQYFLRTSNLKENTISSNIIYSLDFDLYGDLWIGTSLGLNWLSMNTGQFTVFTENDGLPNNQIYGIITDDYGDLWISTNKGISKFSPANKMCVSFDVSDGLQGYEYNSGAYYKSKKGEMFFGGLSGLNSFYSDSIEFNGNKPKIVINSLLIYSSQGRKYVPLSGVDEVMIPPGYSMFNVDFSSLDFTWPEKNKYSYKLTQEDEEGEWVDIGNQHYTTFSNVKPGEYILHVRGTNNDNLWNEEGASIKLIIQTPFYKSKYAIVIYVLMVLLALFGFFYFRTKKLRESNKILKEKEQAAIKIKEQAEELTIQNKAITDSINYAKRIQEALMPSMKMFESLLPESFVYYKPKDIVSGDFFWINENKNKIFVVAADCTGHGVPGAFMSIIGFELFRNITYFKGIEKPSEILTALNKDFASIFNKDLTDVTLRDGMDVAFLAFDKKSNKVEFAGAHNPLYLVRDNKIEKIPSDRFSIGHDEHEIENKQFANQEIQLKEGDVLYIFTDGFPDQFGGTEGKKFKFRRFRHLLLTTHKQKMEEQLDYLDQTMNAWRGDHEQVDDILVIGIRPQIKKTK